jgi:ribonuclease HI
LEKAACHRQGMWVLLRHASGPEEPNLATLRRAAQLYAELPKKSMVLHREGYWESAAWDVESSRFTTQLWRLNMHSEALQQDQALHPEAVQQHLSQVDHLRYAFHWRESPIPPRLLLHRQHQQDALRHDWDGLIAGTDGSVDERTERMGAGYVVGADPEPIMTFHAKVGGPLATARAEAASLLQLLRDVRKRYNHRVHILIFVDCLVVLDILRKWGRSDFHPGPKEIVHFSVIRPLLDELRQWRGNVTLVKVKSHTGCLLNERADEQAELGRSDDGPEICPGPQKYGSFWLRGRPTVREYAEKCGKPLPRDSAPNHSLLEKAAASNTLRAVKKRSTPFVTDLLHHKAGATVSKIIRRCTPAAYRVWLRCMTGIYPVQTYLARIRVVKSPI